MKAIFRLFVAITAVAVCGWTIVHAGDAPPAATGTVAILDGDRILQGEIDRVGDQYRVRRSIGEIWLPGAKVRQLCASLEDAYAFLRSQANLNDPDECLRLTRWCLLHGLKDQALSEVTAAVQMRPGHAESLRLLRGLQRAAANCEATPVRPADEAPPEPAVPEPIAYNAQALGPFVTRVQPVLMNTCASCHAGGKGGSFELTRSHDADGLVNRKTTQLNLLAALGQLNREHPHESPLLKMAVSVHGDADHPPLKGRSAPAYRILEEWVILALADAPRPASASAVGPAMSATGEARTFAEAQPRGPAPASGMPVGGASWAAQYAPPPKEPAPEPSDKSAPTKAPPQPAVHALPDKTASTEPSDQFDPAIFNKQMHSGK